MAQITIPPLGLMTCPVINRLRSSAKNKIACAMSSGSPIHPSGVSSLNSSFVSSSSAAFISVSTTPGATQFTWMPDGPTSFASAFVKPITAAFEAE